MFAVNIEISKNLKYVFLKETLSSSISKCANEDQKYLKKKNQLIY